MLSVVVRMVMSPTAAAGGGVIESNCRRLLPMGIGGLAMTTDFIHGFVSKDMVAKFGFPSWCKLTHEPAPSRMRPCERSHRRSSACERPRRRRPMCARRPRCVAPRHVAQVPDGGWGVVAGTDGDELDGRRPLHAHRTGHDGLPRSRMHARAHARTLERMRECRLEAPHTRMRSRRASRRVWVVPLSSSSCRRPSR